MNNPGNITLTNNLPRNSNLSTINTKAPVSATANSRIKLTTGEFDIHETIISTEVTASNPSVAAARATAKAASIATSALTIDNKYLSQHNLENNFTFQISTFCTIQKIKSEPLKSNVYIKPFQEMSSLTNKNVRNYNKDMSNFQIGTKFENLRRELNSFDEDEDYHKPNYLNEYHVQSLNKSSRLSTFSTLSNMSTCSSIKSEPVTYHSILSESNSLDNTNPSSYESTRKKYAQKNAFLNSDLDSSDSNSNSKKFKISDLKRSDKVHVSESKLRDIKSLSSSQKDINSLYCMETTHGAAYAKYFTLNRNIETLLSNSSSMLETDLDSGTLSAGHLFPQTDFYGNQPSYSFEKTRSMVDLRKNSDVSYEEGITRALSIQNLKKNKPDEEINLITRLKSKAQSTQELRVADSLTKLNVPDWMKDFKLKDRTIPISQPFERKSLMSLGDSNTLKYKDIKRHDSILSKYKYDSLPRFNTKTKEQLSQINQVTLPSSLYRSKSQNLLYFNPKENSKLKNAMESLNSSSKSLIINDTNTAKINENISNFKLENTNKIVETKVIENKIENSPKYQDYRNIEKRFESSIKKLDSEINERNFPKYSKSDINENKTENIRHYFEPKIIEKTIENKNNKIENKSNETKTESLFKSSEHIFKDKKIGSPVKKIESLRIENKPETSIKKVESFSTENKVEEVSVKRVVLSREDFKEEINFKNFEEKDNIIMQSKKESQLFLEKIIDSTLNPFLIIDDICEAFRINPTTLKLLLNVKRKTPNLNRDETFVNMKLNESSYIENSLRKNDNNKFVIFCDFTKCKNELFQSNKVSRTTCSCYNCYTYYCSKKCRNMGFTHHFHACSFKRIREMLLKIRSHITESQIEALSKYAIVSYNSFGRGVMTIAFESCRSADDFVNKQPNRLMSQPYYLKLSEIDEMNTKDFLEYNPEKEFVICLIISATLPMTNVEFSYPTFKYCYNVPLPQQHPIITNKKIVEISHEQKLSPDIKKENINTKVTFDESVILSKEKNEYEIRKDFFNYVINYFNKKNVNLIQNYSSIFKKLEKYMQDGIEFQPLTVYIKDPLLNSTVCCTIFPNKSITLKPVRTASKSNKSVDLELKQNGTKTLAETEI